MFIQYVLAFTVLLRYSYASEWLDELLIFANNTLDLIAGGEVDEITRKRWQYSGANLSHMGKFRRCNNLDDSKYTLFYQEILDGPLALYLAFCGPKACTESDYDSVLKTIDLQTIVKNVADNNLFGIPLDGLFKHHPGVKFPMDKLEDNNEIGVVGWITVIIWFTLIALGFLTFALVDCGVVSQNNILNIFHVNKNFHAIFHAVDGQKRQINTTKACSYGWMNICISLLVLAIYTASTNPQDFPWLARTYFFAIAYSGHFGANTFLWVSGFLVAYRYGDRVPQLRDIPVRLIRIMPVSWLAMLLTWKVVPYGVFIEAPLWFRQDDVNDDCHEYWWTNFLLVSNFVPDWKGNYCFPASWAIACEMQCWICVFFICYAWNRWSKWIGMGICGALGGVCIAMTYYVPWKETLNTVWFSKQCYDQYVPYFMIKPYVKGIFSIMGFLCGKFYIRKYNWIDKTWTRLLLLFIGFALCSISVWVAAPNWHDIYNNYETWDRTDNTLIVGSRNLLFCIALCVTLVPIYRQDQSFLTRFMHTDSLDILGRLSYCACLLNWMFATAYPYAIPQALSLTVAYVLKFTFSVSVISYFFAAPLSIFVEQPCIALANRLKGRPMHMLMVEINIDTRSSQFSSAMHSQRLGSLLNDDRTKLL